MLAVVANVAMLLQIARRLPFGVGVTISVVGWYLAAFLLIGLIAAAPAHLPLSDGATRTFAQAYYYAIMASAIYCIIASLLVDTATGKYIGRYSRDFKLTMAQRTLMLQTITFLGYILASAAVYSRIEGWEYLDAVYWVDVTLFTVGFGDLAPKTHLGRALLFPCAVGGILFLGLIIASIRTLVPERSTRKISLRMVERTRSQVLQRLDPHKGTARTGIFQKHGTGNAFSSELDRREQEFNAMREIQSTAATQRRWTGLLMSGGLWLGLWLIGAVVFWRAEQPVQGWSYFDSVYFTYVSLITIGYGDSYPQDNSSKPFFVFWSLIALPTLTVLIGSVGEQSVGEQSMGEQSMGEQSMGNQSAGEADDKGEEIQDEVGRGGGQAHGSTAWSWLSPKSPLMRSTDEAKWVLDRLVETLNGEPKRQRHDGGAGAGAGAAAWERARE